MSYQSRRKCKDRNIIPCGLCPLMFKCPYDEDKEKYKSIRKE